MQQEVAIMQIDVPAQFGGNGDVELRLHGDTAWRASSYYKVYGQARRPGIT